MKLTSPNYPEPYDPLEDCTWTITAPQGHYVTLDIEIIDVSNKYNIYIYTTYLFYLESTLMLVQFLYISIFNSLTIIMMMITYQYKRLILMEIKNW